MLCARGSDVELTAAIQLAAEKGDSTYHLNVPIDEILSETATGVLSGGLREIAARVRSHQALVSVCRNDCCITGGVCTSWTSVQLSEVDHFHENETIEGSGETGRAESGVIKFTVNE